MGHVGVAGEVYRDCSSPWLETSLPCKHYDCIHPFQLSPNAKAHFPALLEEAGILSWCRLYSTQFTAMVGTALWAASSPPYNQTNVYVSRFMSVLWKRGGKGRVVVMRTVICAFSLLFFSFFWGRTIGCCGRDCHSFPKATWAGVFVVENCKQDGFSWLALCSL